MLVLAMEFSRSAPATRAVNGPGREGGSVCSALAHLGRRTRAARSLTTEQRRPDLQRGGGPGETRRSRTCPLAAALRAE
jgi:hypothetical protein